MRVVNNTHRDELISGLLDRSTFHHLLLENGNGAIGLAYCDIARSTAIYVHWDDFFLNCESLHSMACCSEGKFFIGDEATVLSKTGAGT